MKWIVLHKERCFNRKQVDGEPFYDLDLCIEQMPVAGGHLIRQVHRFRSPFDRRGQVFDCAPPIFVPGETHGAFFPATGKVTAVDKDDVYLVLASRHEHKKEDGSWEESVLYFDPVLRRTYSRPTRNFEARMKPALEEKT